MLRSDIVFLIAFSWPSHLAQCSGPSKSAMKVAILQFSPELGTVTSNIARADSILAASSAYDIDILVLPELVFTGYNHTRESILPLLEPAETGISSKWAASTARKYNCIVTVGYPEITDHDDGTGQDVKAYNSTITIAPTGQVLAHYRKTHLYYTDEPWALEGPDKWLTTTLPLSNAPDVSAIKAAFGICMDLNSYRFQSEWTAYEFSNAALSSRAEILLLSMAWLTSLPATEVKHRPEAPDMDTFSYWINRLMPLVESETGVLVVCANRCGEEPGQNPCGQVEEGVRYAGSSWVGRVGKGKVSVWGLMGRAEEGMLVVDTEEEAKTTFRIARREKVEDGIGEDGG